MLLDSASIVPSSLTKAMHFPSGITQAVGRRYGPMLDVNASAGVTQTQAGTTGQQTPPATATQSTTATVPVATVVSQSHSIDVQQLSNTLMQSVSAAVNTAVQTHVAPVAQQAAQLAQRIDQLGQPQRNVQALFGGGAPAIRQGESVLNSRGFQYQRLVGYHQGFDGYGQEQCKHELEFTQALESLYRQGGFVKSGMTDSRGRPSTIVPLSTRMIPDEFKATLRQKFGDVEQLIRQGVSGADPGQMAWMAQRAGLPQGQINQALSIFDDSAMGIFTEAGPHGELIDLIRNRSVLDRVGVTNVTLPPNGVLPFPKQTGASTGYWVGENTATTSSQPTTGRMELRAKKAGALVTTPNELLQFASVDTEAFLRNDLASVLALLIDTAGLEGSGTTLQPRGVLTHSGIQTHTRTVTLGSDGNTFEPETPGGMISDVEEANYDPDTDGFAFVMRARTWEKILSRRAAAHTAGTEDGAWLFPVNRGDVSAGKPSLLAGHPVIRSAQVSNTRAKGSSSALTYVLGGIWKHFLLGRIGILEFAMATQGDTIFANYQTQLRAIDFVDTGLRYENAFVLCDTIDNTLP